VGRTGRRINWESSVMKMVIVLVWIGRHFFEWERFERRDGEVNAEYLWALDTGLRLFLKKFHRRDLPADLRRGCIRILRFWIVYQSSAKERLNIREL
jgi:hypothetical protein